MKGQDEFGVKWSPGQRAGVGAPLIYVGITIGGLGRAGYENAN